MSAQPRLRVAANNHLGKLRLIPASPLPKSDFGLLCKPPVVEPPFEEDEGGGGEGEPLPELETGEAGGGEEEAAGAGGGAEVGFGGVGGID